MNCCAPVWKFCLNGLYNHINYFQLLMFKLSWDILDLFHFPKYSAIWHILNYLRFSQRSEKYDKEHTWHLSFSGEAAGSQLEYAKIFQITSVHGQINRCFGYWLAELFSWLLWLQWQRVSSGNCSLGSEIAFSRLPLAL